MRGEGEPLLPGQDAAVRPPPGQRSCRTPVAAVTAFAERADLDNAGSVGRRRRHLQRVRLAGPAGSSTAPNAASCSLVLVGTGAGRSARI
jgi:hypothetical protein